MKTQAVQDYDLDNKKHYWHRTQKTNKPWLFELGMKRDVEVTLYRGISKSKELTGEELGTWWTPDKELASQFSNRRWNAPYPHSYNKGARVSWKTFEFNTAELFLIHPLTQTRLPRGKKMIDFLKFVKSMDYKGIVVIPEPDIPVAANTWGTKKWYTIHPRFNEYRGYQWFIFDELEF